MTDNKKQRTILKKTCCNNRITKVVKGEKVRFAALLQQEIKKAVLEQDENQTSTRRYKKATEVAKEI